MYFSLVSHSLSLSISISPNIHTRAPDKFNFTSPICVLGLFFPSMCGLIDLNAAHDGDEAASFDSPSAALAIGSSSSHVCLELWHACAGPLISLPKKGSVVVYFPQGHLEHVSEFPAAAYDLPPHVFCRVFDVKLHVSHYPTMPRTRVIR